jgi:hypothetical protein
VILAEPVTMLTDYALAGLCAYLSAKLLQQTPAQRPVKLWGVAFAFLALSAFAGGSWHGFAPSLGAYTLAVIWKITVYAAGLFGLFMVAGTILATVARHARGWLLGAVGLKYLIYAVWMGGHDDFHYVALDAAGSMVVLLLLHGYCAYTRGDQASHWIIAGVLASALAALVQASGFTLHRHFNQNDLYHVIQIAAMVLFYQGGKQLRIYSAAASPP